MGLPQSVPRSLTSLKPSPTWRKQAQDYLLRLRCKSTHAQLLAADSVTVKITPEVAPSAWRQPHTNTTHSSYKGRSNRGYGPPSSASRSSAPSAFWPHSYTPKAAILLPLLLMLHLGKLLAAPVIQIKI